MKPIVLFGHFKRDYPNCKPILINLQFFVNKLFLLDCNILLSIDDQNGNYIRREELEIPCGLLDYEPKLAYFIQPSWIVHHKYVHLCSGSREELVLQHISYSIVTIIVGTPKGKYIVCRLNESLMQLQPNRGYFTGIQSEARSCVRIISPTTEPLIPMSLITLSLYGTVVPNTIRKACLIDP